jgi:hypothetical protein
MSHDPLDVVYLVHNLSDAAVRRRTTMLRDGGARVTVAGFRRGAEPVSRVADARAVDLGQTHNARLVQRTWSVIRELLLNRHPQMFCNADVIVARNLEMLALAVGGCAFNVAHAKLVYECLDIHRLLLGSGVLGRTMRSLEAWLARRASALFISSPAFVSNYFEPLSGVRLPVRLIENKVYAPGVPLPEPTARTPGPPWHIGWFGAIRCRRSFDILSALVRENPGRIEVIIRGVPALDQFEDFHRQTRETPGLSYRGPYRYPEDLAAIYGEVHFTWAVDMFEEGLNSSWLLPNRVYEGGLHGSVPIALDSVETGRFIRRLGIGVTLPDTLRQSVSAFFENLTAERYRHLARECQGVSRTAWIHEQRDCIELVGFLRDLTAVCKPAGSRNDR